MREGALHDAAIGEHVADAGGHTKIVFEHDELAVGEAEEIGPDDCDVDVAGNLEAAHLAAIVLAAVDQFAGDDEVVEDLGFGVYVAQEVVEGGDALGEAALNVVPLAGGDESRQQVVGKDALGAFVGSIDREGDSLVEEREIGGLLAPLEFFTGQAGEGFGKRLVRRAQFSSGLAHLVKRAVERVVAKEGVELDGRAGTHC
jgi:hypothetical protein